MKKILSISVILICFLHLCTFLPLFSAPEPLVADKYIEQLSPLKAHQKADKEILKYVRNTHYLKPAINDQLSVKIFGSFLSELDPQPVSYTHLRAHETVLDLVCRLLLEKKNTFAQPPLNHSNHH